MWLVVIAAAALVAMIGFIAWPRLFGDETSPQTGVGIVVVSAPAPTSVAPATAVEVAPAPTTTVVAADDEPHRTRRRPTADPAPHVDSVPTPPPTSAPASAAGGEGNLSLITSPWTHVTEGGRDLGDTPLVRVPMSAGHHTLRLVNTEAGISETYDVEITAGQTTSRRLGLR
jgi:serine/threonine-protein kinase